MRFGKRHQRVEAQLPEGNFAVPVLARAEMPVRFTAFRLRARVLALAVSLALPATGAAQKDDSGFWSEPQGELFLYGHAALPVGEFRTHVDLGSGAGFGGLLFLDRDRMAALRADGNFVVYGSEYYDAPLSPTVPVDVRVQTTNAILSAGVGPQIYLTRGAVRPYVFGTFGFSYFVTETGVRGLGDGEPFASSVNFDDFGMALNGGGGVSVGVYRGEVSVALDVSASYQHNGIAEYLVKGDLGRSRLHWDRWYRDTHRSRGRERVGRDLVGDPIVSDANLVMYRIGVSLGVG